MTDGTLSQDIGSPRVLYMALELSASTWLISFSDGGARSPRRKRLDAGDLAGLEGELGRAKLKFGLSPDAPTVSCYEAGRDGFWIHRALSERGVTNHVVESASIEVPRHARRAKTDSLDVAALLRLLIRFDRGDHNVWRTVCVPTEADEDARRLHRERERLKKEVTQLRNRIFGLLATEGLKIEPDELKAFLGQPMCSRDGRPLGQGLLQELSRMEARLELLRQQQQTLEKEQHKALRNGQAEDERMKKVARLMCLCGIGIQGAWILVMEFFGWRKFRNRREVGALAGLTGTPFNSGASVRDQGISKAGNKRVRRLMVELAWLWVRHQPNSSLTKWFLDRWGNHGVRSKKGGIVALARKLLIALWNFLERGSLPPGTTLSPSKGVAAATLSALPGAVAA